MKLAHLSGATYRVHTPRWAYAPLGGEGAVAHGGRANRPGVAALYLSLELETAIAEYRQLSSLMPPGLIVSYQVDVGPLVDLRDGVDESWDPLWQDFYYDWRALHFGEGVEPPSWVLATSRSPRAPRGSSSPQ